MADELSKKFSWVDDERDFHNRSNSASNNLSLYRRSMNRTGLALNAMDFVDVRNKAIAPATDAPPTGIKVIDDESEVKWRDQSPQEIERNIAYARMMGTIAGASATRNLGDGWILGKLSERIAEPIIRSSQVPQDYYIRRKDLHGLENDLQAYNQRMDEVNATNNKPYND